VNTERIWPAWIVNVLLKGLGELLLGAFILLAVLPTVFLTTILLLLAFLPLLILWPALFAAWRLLEAKRRIAEEPPDPDTGALEGWCDSRRQIREEGREARA
jgi:hypothetical protein